VHRLRRRMNELTIDLGAGSHLDHFIMQVADDTGSRPEFDEFADVDVALDRTMQHHPGYPHTAFHAAVLADTEKRFGIPVGDYATVDYAVDVAATLETKVALDPRASPDQGMHRFVLAPFAAKHHCSPRA